MQSQATNHATTILVPVDFSMHSRAAALRACGLAAETGASIHLIHALHLPPVAQEAAVPEDFWDGLRESEREKLEAFARDLESEDIPITTAFEERDPVDMIRSAALAEQVGLVVMGSHGHRGIDRMLLGSVAERTVQRSPVPVLVVREDESDARKPIRNIFFATDFSEDAERAERIVARWSVALNAQVEVFHAIRETAVLFAPYAVPGSSDFEGEMHEAATRRMEVVLERLRSAGVSAKSKIVYGLASDEITKHADASGADLIALGARGYSTLQRFLLGNVAERVMRQAHCSVLIVRDGKQ
ncbi:MAG: universal stress protein [Deltaproteobacteria bacterium]|jgi:nucleotide-binding universal stress UspA family protein|nr:universal stress protein [Deltaproteobacteria bacterium]